jgi:hypothetical protein
MQLISEFYFPRARLRQISFKSGKCSPEWNIRRGLLIPALFEMAVCAVAELHQDAAPWRRLGSVTRPRPEGLVLSYKLSGRVDDVYLPAVRPTARGDELWQHTCFEAFVRASSGSEYYEFNFSPSTQSAVYRFTDYRNGMCVAAEVSTPPIDVRLDAQSFLCRPPWRQSFVVTA